MSALLSGVAAACLLATALAFLTGGLSAGVAWAALTGGAAVAFAAWWPRRRRRIAVRKLGPWEWAAVTAFALFAGRAFLWLVFTAGDEIRVLSPNNLGDLSLHLTYIRFLANGIPFWPANPILSGTPLTYPLGVDLFHALILLAGGDLLRTFLWLGLAGAALTGVALWRWGGAFTLAGFLCNGGLAGFAVFFTGALEDFQAPTGWKSIPLALLVTQRGLLFALPAGLTLLRSWRARFLNDRHSPCEPLWQEVLLYAALPLFHLHTFIFLSLLLAAWFAFHPPARAGLARLVALAFVPATVLTVLVTGRFHTPAAIGWQPGWMQSDPAYHEFCRETLGVDSAWFTAPFFWLYNFGALPVLCGFLLARLYCPARSNAEAPDRSGARLLAIPALAIFLLCCFVKFAPWEWDNTKLMIWSYLLLLPLLWEQLLSRWALVWRGLAILLLFGSGAISLLGGLDGTHRGYAIARRSELDFLEAALHPIPPSERIMAHPDYNHPLLLLGRPLALGYIGHVWSHGYDYLEPERRVTAIMNGEGAWREEATRLGCRYLYWGSREVAAYPDSTQPWRETAAIAGRTEDGTLYDLESPPEVALTAPTPP